MLLSASVHSGGKLAEAELHFTAVLEAEYVGLKEGEENRDTLNVRRHLAEVALETGALRSAEQEIRTVLARFVSLLDAAHPTTNKARHVLAKVLLRSGKVAEAEKEFRTVIAVSADVFGADNDRTFPAREGWASALAALGRRDEAERESRSVQEARRRLAQTKGTPRKGAKQE